MTIESYLSKKLEEFFVEKGVFQTLINKLNDEWTVSKKLRYLKTENRITKDDFKVYDKLRVIRNRIIHSEYRPTSDEAEECKLTANDTLWKLFRMDGLEYKLFYNRMKKLIQQDWYDERNS